MRESDIVLHGVEEAVRAFYRGNTNGTSIAAFPPMVSAAQAARDAGVSDREIHAAVRRIEMEYAY